MPNSAGSNRYLRWLKTLTVYLLIFVVGGFIGNLWMTRGQTSGPAPVIIGPDLEQQLVRIDFAIADAPRLLYFFAEWCPICKAQHAVINNLNKSVTVLGIAMQSGTTEQVAKYVEQQALRFPVINDETGQISRAYGVQGVPAIFIIDNQGQIAFSTRGYSSGLGLHSRLWLTK
ncbi:MAG: protein disulfide oxidoreductase [Gammaproteobacteria bacterium]|nr:protein disulfide oxidoreductase [Gammaproteobacteria bacterium]